MYYDVICHESNPIKWGSRWKLIKFNIDVNEKEGKRKQERKENEIKDKERKLKQNQNKRVKSYGKEKIFLSTYQLLIGVFI